MTEQRLKSIETEIRKNCPAKIVETDSIEWKGVYYSDDNIIMVLPSLEGSERLLVLRHESQHAMCRKRNCSCQATHTQEYHAMLAEMKLVIAVGDNEMTERFCSTMQRLARREYDDQYGHRSGARRIVKHKSYTILNGG